MTTRRDATALRSADPGGILEAFLSLPEQVAASYRAARKTGGAPFAPGTLTFCGMGGSAAAGDALVAAYGDHLLIPVASHRGHSLPGHCSPGDLVVCLSFSGDTEETLAAYAEAVARGCRVVAVCSGGELAARAEADGAAVYRVPADAPMPRAALGHLAGAALGALAALGVVPEPGGDVEEVREVVGAMARGLAPEAGGGEALELAEALGDRLPVVWGSEGLAEPAAWRWKCAFNENAKVPAFASALPELDHHEVAGWSEGHGEGFSLVALRHDGEHPSVEPRLRATLDAIRPSGLEAREVRAQGRSSLARVLSLMLLGDAASTYHGLLRGVDPTPIDAISLVKARLAGDGG